MSLEQALVQPPSPHVNQVDPSQLGLHGRQRTSQPTTRLPSVTDEPPGFSKSRFLGGGEEKKINHMKMWNLDWPDWLSVPPWSWLLLQITRAAEYVHSSTGQCVCFALQSSGETSPASLTPAGTPSLGGTHAPKYGTVIPNRIFVGGIAANVSLFHWFRAYFANKSHGHPDPNVKSVRRDLGRSSWEFWFSALGLLATLNRWCKV